MILQAFLLFLDLISFSFLLHLANFIDKMVTCGNMKNI